MTFGIYSSLLMIVPFSVLLISQFYLLKVGVGMSMEGIEQNPVVYDLMSEMAFRHNRVDIKVNQEALQCMLYTFVFILKVELKVSPKFLYIHLKS